MTSIGTLLDGTAWVLAALSFTGWCITFASTLATLALVILHGRLRRAGLADERERLARPLPPDAMLPDVVLQIPAYNEGTLVARALDAAMALDWPRDRLHVQVLDDSTDGSTALARDEVERRRLAGLDAVVIHRSDRREFKAGALANGMDRTPHGYFAILDVDYVPAPDFLRLAMTCLLAEPGLPFIQARFDYLNADANHLTRTQAVLLDAHLAIEQATRGWAGHPLPFNGTCGIWRRDAIEQAGGWRGGTLAEDLDLSYRAWLQGRRGRFLMTVAVPGELPETFEAWTQQQRRWTKGFGEVVVRMICPILFDRRVSIRNRLRALMHLGVWWSGPAWAVSLPAGFVAIVLRPAFLWSLGVLLAIQVVAGYGALFVFLRAGNASLRPGQTSFWRFVGGFWRVSRNLFAIGGSIGPAQREVIFRRRSDFVRTPKSSGTGRGQPAPPDAQPDPDGR